MSEQPTILNIAGVNKRFGGLQALTDVGITIKQGQIYGLIGPNGAGKTTFFNVITGLYQPDTGTFELADKYPKYYKAVPAHVPRDEVDTYVVNMMFPIDDPTGTLLHARKKLLVPGVRSGGKDMLKDVTEARDSLNRWIALQSPEY